ncbi:MAG: uracil-DNA glycosylase [Actinomycetota bacterium]|nr:MAG: uracil-DNA glycosylase [Actinomycetota bacterium]
MPPVTDDRRRAFDDLRREVEGCARCVLAETRTRAVFGEGDPDAELMFVGEAPGYHEDQQGRPFVGAAGKLLDELLAAIGLRREQVFIANVLKSRPPNNRDPRPEEIAACQPYLWQQIELIEPLVICTLGNFATKLLSGDQAGITRVHGRPRAAVIAGRETYLYPIFHPAAALYTPAMLTTLKEDVARLPELLAHARDETPGTPRPDTAPWGEETNAPATRPRPDAATAARPDPASPARPDAAQAPAVGPAQAEQLGLF